MNKKYKFPVPGCGQCMYHLTVNNGINVTKYCTGFKRKEPRRFRSSDPKFKAPRWCPKRITPPVCRVYGFKDEQSAYMDFFWRTEYKAGRMKTVSPSSFRYKFRTEIQLQMTAEQFFDASQEELLHDILAEEVSVGEIIEIDDGLRPYYFYVLDFATVIPLPYFHFSSTI